MIHFNKNLALFLKLSLSILLCYWVYSKLNLALLEVVLKDLKIVFLGISILCFLCSQWFSALRLKIVLQAEGFNIDAVENQKLYLLGMFYNFFIPGGIGGDAYKIYHLNKVYKWAIKPLGSALFIDRFLGLTALLSLLVSCGIPFPFFPLHLKIPLIIFLLFLIIISSFLIVSKWFKSLKLIYFKALFLAFIVQGFQVISIYFILKSLDIEEYSIYYIGIFLISVLLSLFSFAGIGIREYIFYESSILLSIEEEKSISIALIFTLITAVTSLLGMYYHFQKIKPNSLR